jgi:hypothetical protein
VGAADRIAEVILRQGEIAGRGAQNTGAIWGGALQNLGQTVAALPTYVQNQRMREQEVAMRNQEMQMRTSQMQEMQRKQAAEDALNNAYSKALGPDGNVNMQLLASGVANTPAASQWPAIQEHVAKAQQEGATYKKTLGEVADQQRSHMSAIANAAEAGGSDPETQAGLLLALVAQGDKSGTIAHDDAVGVISQLHGDDGSLNLAAVPQVIGRMKALSAGDVEKRASAAAAAARLTNEQAALPGIQAESTQKQAVASTMVGGRTAAQIADDERQAAAAKAAEAARIDAGKRADQNLGLERQRVGMEGQRLGLEQQKFKASQAGAAPATGMAVPDVAPGQKNEDFIKTLPPPVASQVKALAEGRMAFPQGAALRSDYWQNMLQNVAKYDPSFDAVNYNARSKTRADFTSGKAAQQVNAINTVIGHLSGLSDAAEALNNSDIPAFNSIANSISKATGSPKVTNFDTIKKAVSDEVTRVWRQSGGSEADIQAAQKNLDASGSPAQLRGAIATYADLLESKLGSLNEQYRQGMGTDKIDMITPGAQKALDAIEKRAGRAPAPASGRVVVGGIPFPSQAAADKALADWKAKQGQK